MFKGIVLAATLATCIAISGCATIVHSGPRAISVGSAPVGAKVSIYDRSNALVMTNTTPFIAQLSTKYGYFKAQDYRLVFEMAGYSTTEVNLTSSVSGWYFANLVFGGVIGMLIVDPLTGAMYNLSPDKIDQALTSSRANLIRDRSGFLVILSSEITEQERSQMVRVN